MSKFNKKHNSFIYTLYLKPLYGIVYSTKKSVPLTIPLFLKNNFSYLFNKTYKNFVMKIKPIQHVLKKVTRA